eukprot:3095590-Pyramimonas_sp.AAC.1
MMKDKTLHTQYTPPAQLQESTARVRLRTKAYDITLCVMYSPPEKGHANHGTISPWKKQEMGGREGGKQGLGRQQALFGQACNSIGTSCKRGGTSCKRGGGKRQRCSIQEYVCTRPIVSSRD